MSFVEQLKRFKYADSHLKKNDQQTEEDQFIKFYRNLLSEIASHLDYERDLTDSLGNQSKVLKPFQLEEYADRINDFFHKLARSKRKNALEETTVANLFYMILVLPSKEEPAVSKEIRRRLFSRVIVRYAEDFNRPPAVLLKALYERLQHGRGAIFGADTEELMEMLRNSAAHIDVELRIAGNSGKSITTDELKKIMDATFKLKDEKQRRKLMNPLLGLDFIVTGMVRIVCAFLLVVYTEPIKHFLVQRLPNVFQPLFLVVLLQGAAFVIILWTFISAIKCGNQLSRRHIYKRLNMILNN